MALNQAYCHTWQFSWASHWIRLTIFRLDVNIVKRFPLISFEISSNVANHFSTDRASNYMERYNERLYDCIWECVCVCARAMCALYTTWIFLVSMAIRASRSEAKQCNAHFWLSRLHFKGHHFPAIFFSFHLCSHSNHLPLHCCTVEQISLG